MAPGFLESLARGDGRWAVGSYNAAVGMEHLHNEYDPTAGMFHERYQDLLSKLDLRPSATCVEGGA